jgi:putative addiction module component (TIGR02574 family)
MTGELPRFVPVGREGVGRAKGSTWYIAQMDGGRTNMTASEIVERATKLPPHERAAIARSLLESLEVAPQVNEVEWSHELIARSNALHQGYIVPENWRTVVERVRRSLPPGAR